MKERINRLARGIMDYDEMQVSFSTTEIEKPVIFDDKMRDDLFYQLQSEPVQR